eukprot:SAG31_NODE_108_length_24741_cov_6.933041_20_plen_125_part_00
MKKQRKSASSSSPVVSQGTGSSSDFHDGGDQFTVQQQQQQQQPGILVTEDDFSPAQFLSIIHKVGETGDSVFSTMTPWQDVLLLQADPFLLRCDLCIAYRKLILNIWNEAWTTCVSRLPITSCS